MFQFVFEFIYTRSVNNKATAVFLMKVCGLKFSWLFRTEQNIYFILGRIQST